MKYVKFTRILAAVPFLTTWRLTVLLPTVYTASEFLEEINEKGCRPFELEGIDTVIIAPCASGNGKGYFAQVSRGLSWKLDKEGFDRYLKRAPSAKKILLLTECCFFQPWFIDGLKETYPNIEWVVPKTSDYCENMNAEGLRKDLKAAKVLKESIQETPSF